MSSNVSEVKVWSRFERKLKNGDLVKLKIQNIPEGKEADVIEYMCKYYVYEEVWVKSSGIAKNPASLDEFKSLKTDMLKKHPSLICCVDNGDDNQDRPLEIVGCNCLYRAKRNEKPDIPPIESEELQNLFRIIEQYEKMSNIYEKCGVNEQLSGAGMSVHPDYRRCGIAVELLKARRPLCEDLGITVTSASFTAISSQRAAEKAGYELLLEVDYKSFGDLCGVTFITDSPSFKIQYMTILK